MDNRDFTKYTIDAAIRLALLLILGYWCFLIISPFVVILLWAVIIAVAVYPLFAKLKAALGGRNKLAATVYTLVALAILITPTFMVSNSIIYGFQLHHRYVVCNLGALCDRQHRYSPAT